MFVDLFCDCWLWKLMLIMVYVNSDRTRENEFFNHEKMRFLTMLNSGWYDDISLNDLKIISRLPYFISKAHPYIYSSESDLYPFFGVRKNNIVAYATHPMTVTNILLSYGFTDVSTLYIAGLHDGPEEFDSLIDKFSDVDDVSDLGVYRGSSKFLEKFIFKELLEYGDKFDCDFSDDFFDVVESGVNILTPDKNLKSDLSILNPSDDLFYVKCADVISVNSDPENMLIRQLGNGSDQVKKLDDRINKANVLIDLWNNYKRDLYGSKQADVYERDASLGNLDGLPDGFFSKRRTLVRNVKDCKEFLWDFQKNLKSSGNELSIAELRVLRKKVQMNHPSYVNVGYTFRL